MELQELKANWEEFGRTDPLWAVLSDPVRRHGQWNLAEFFSSGERDVDALLENLFAIGASPRSGRALDFGCGVGRLSQALARRFRRVDGVDIASSMIDQARDHNQHGERCRYHVNERDDLSIFPDGTFDFVYSMLVLQHMRPKYALRYIREFVRVTARGGIIVFQIPIETLRRRALPPEAFSARIEVLGAPSEMIAGSLAEVHLRVTNASPVPWTRSTPEGVLHDINLGNHWIDDRGFAAVVDDGRRPLDADLACGESVELNLNVRAPSVPGTYGLEFDVVQEGVAWFKEHGSPTVCVAVKVSANGERADVVPSLGSTAVMETYTVPHRKIRRAVQSRGGAIIDVSEEAKCGPSYRSVRYVLRKGSRARQFARRLALPPFRPLVDRGADTVERIFGFQP